MSATGLDRLLAQASQEGTNTALLVEALADAELLVPVPGPVPAESAALSVEAEQPVGLPVWHRASVDFIPAFTPGGGARADGRRADGLPPPPGGATRGGDQRRSAARHEPALTASGARPAGRAESHLGAPCRTAVRHREPAEEPIELIRAVRKRLAEGGEVRRAWRAMVRLPGRAREVLVGLELASGASPDAVMTGYAGTVREANGGSGVLVVVDAARPDEIARYLLTRDPFWTAPPIRRT